MRKNWSEAIFRIPGNEFPSYYGASHRDSDVFCPRLCSHEKFFISEISVPLLSRHNQHVMNMCTAALLMGGNVRVELEDNLYLEKGIKARSSAEQVAKIIRIAKEPGIDPATPDEARKILKLKGNG